MFDPGDVLHAARSAALRMSLECFARRVVPRQARDDKSPTVPSRASPKQSGGGTGGFWGQEEKATHHLCNGRSIRSFAQGSRHSLQSEAELPHSTKCLQSHQCGKNHNVHP